MQPIIRIGVHQDIPAIYAISRSAHCRSYGDMIPLAEQARFTQRYTYSKDGLEKFVKRIAPRIEDPSWSLWVAEVDGSIVGYTMSERVGESHISMRGLFVDPDYQNQGVGNLLFQKLLVNTSKGDISSLVVIKDNKHAKRLYEKYGFKKVGTADKTFFGAEQDIMELQLD